MRPTEVPVLIGDPSKLKSATNWSPEHSLDATLDAVFAEARER
jgi:GDP-D-mannose dehydratase